MGLPALLRISGRSVQAKKEVAKGVSVEMRQAFVQQRRAGSRTARSTAYGGYHDRPRPFPRHDRVLHGVFPRFEPYGVGGESRSYGF